MQLISKDAAIRTLKAAATRLAKDKMPALRNSCVAAGSAYTGAHDSMCTQLLCTSHLDGALNKLQVESQTLYTRLYTSKDKILT